MERFAKIAADALSQVLPAPIPFTDLEIPPDPTLGDFAFPCFKLAKQLRKSPNQIAQDFKTALEAKVQKGDVKLPGLAVSVTGPYVNFTVSSGDVLKAICGDILNGVGDGSRTYGSLPSESRGSWVIEYSSPNVAKPLNIYHLRPTALGAALDRIGRYRGYRVISINHLGDWGKQYGMLVAAFRLFGKTVDSPLSMTDLVDLYVRVNAEAEKNPAIEEEARQAFLKLEQGDAAVTGLWKKCVQISVQEFERNYQRLGVHFDHIWGESFYKDQLQPLLELLRKKGLLIESEGAWVVPVEDEDGKELPPCILQKSDGATIYATRDVAAAIYRYEKFHFDRMTYIVGAEQRLHFKQVFGVLRKMGYDWAKRCEHISFGLYRFKDAKMSTRKGNFVTLDEVLLQAKERVNRLMAERKEASQSRKVSEGLDDLSPQEVEAITEAVAIGSVVYHDLRSDPVKDVEFDLERVVDFEGETGAYLQYAHTRCLSILRKSGQSQPIQFSLDRISYLNKAEEIQLVKVLGQFPLHLERTLEFGKASQLAQYLIEVTKAFGAFYRECQVLGNSPELTEARLMLVEATRRILAKGLELLGIPLPSRM